MKRFIALLLCFVMLLGVVGCGSKTAEVSTADQEKTVESNNSDSKDAGAEKATEGEEIHLSAILMTGYEFFQDAINEYCEKNPNVTCDVQIMDTESYKVLIKTKFASNDVPDLIPVLAEDDYYSYFDNGYLADLSDMTETIDRLNEGALANFLVPDKGVMGIPYTQQILLAYYNRDMFKKYGLEAPTTWEELINVCSTLKENGIIPVALGHKDTWVCQMLPYSLNATSVQAADPTFYTGTADGSRKFAENPGWLDTLTKYMELFDAGYINDGSLSTSAEQMYEMLIKQEAGMVFTGNWGDDSIYAMSPTFDVGGFPIPAEGGNKGVSTSITGGFGISAQSEHLDETKKLLSYILSKEVLEKYGKTINTCFSDVDADVSGACNEALGMMAGIPGYQYDNTYFASGVQDVMFSSMQEMFSGTKTPMEVLEDMDAATAKANK